MTSRRQIVGALAACLVAGSIAWLVGVTVRGSLLIALLVAGLVPLFLYPLEDTKVLPPAPPRLRHGARIEVSRLSWAMAGRGGRADIRVVRRLRTTAYRRLADLHLDPEHPDQAELAEKALGSWAYGVVVGNRTELTRGEVGRLVDAIDQLGSQRRGAVPNRPRGPVGTEQ
jgi:uncharacterized membrane protein YccC